MARSSGTGLPLLTAEQRALPNNSVLKLTNKKYLNTGQMSSFVTTNYIPRYEL